MHPIDNSEHTV